MRQIIAGWLRRMADRLDGRPVITGPIFQNVTEKELDFLKGVAATLERAIAYPDSDRMFLLEQYRRFQAFLIVRAR